jgi:hypothetical protein
MRWCFHLGGPLVTARAVASGATHGLPAQTGARGRMRQWDRLLVAGHRAIQHNPAYVGALGRALYAFAAGTGHVLWKYLTGGVVMWRPAAGT